MLNPTQNQISEVIQSNQENSSNNEFELSDSQIDLKVISDLEVIEEKDSAFTSSNCTNDNRAETEPVKRKYEIFTPRSKKSEAPIHINKDWDVEKSLNASIIDIDDNPNDLEHSTGKSSCFADDINNQKHLNLCNIFAKYLFIFYDQFSNYTK